MAVGSFVVQHIDSVIQLAAGAFFTWFGFRRRGSPITRSTKVFRICGLGLIAVGGLLLLKPDAAATWQKTYTADRMASAEFPGPAKVQESDDTLAGVTVKRTSATYDVPGKDIALFLSSSALPAETRAMSDDQRIEATCAYFRSQGNQVLPQEKVPATSPTIYRLAIRQDAQKSTVRMAIGYTGENAYRVVASWTDGQEDATLTDRFINSFRIAEAEGRRSR